MHAHDTYLRWLYRGGRPSRFGRVLNRLSAVMFSAGIMPSRAATLEITGRKSGRPVSFPVVIADYRGERYLVSMLGANTNWVRNLTAADGQAVLRHGRQELIYLQEIPVADRARCCGAISRSLPGGGHTSPSTAGQTWPSSSGSRPNTRSTASSPGHRPEPPSRPGRQPPFPPARLG